VGELRNPENIGVEEMNMLLARFFSARTKSKQIYEYDSLKSIKTSISIYHSDGNVDIHAIVLTIENYENRTVTAISVKSNSVLSTVINNNSVQRTAISLVPIMPNPRITLDLFPYSNIQEYVTIMCMAQMLRIII
jgi:hypothetical protein